MSTLGVLSLFWLIFWKSVKKYLKHVNDLLFIILPLFRILVLLEVIIMNLNWFYTPGWDFARTRPACLSIPPLLRGNNFYEEFAILPFIWGGGGGGGNNQLFSYQPIFYVIAEV